MMFFVVKFMRLKFRFSSSMKVLKWLVFDFCVSCRMMKIMQSMKVLMLKVRLNCVIFVLLQFYIVLVLLLCDEVVVGVLVCMVELGCDDNQVDEGVGYVYQCQCYQQCGLQCDGCWMFQYDVLVCQYGVQYVEVLFGLVEQGWDGDDVGGEDWCGEYGVECQLEFEQWRVVVEYDLYEEVVWVQDGFWCEVGDQCG